MFTAYSGNSAYCYSNRLRMCLQHAGILPLPDVSLRECLTGMPFSATFLQREAPLFFPSPASTNPDDGLTRALTILGWACTVWRGDEADLARVAFREALREGPVLLRPLDLGFLHYDPNHAQKRGGDHFIVALKCEADSVLVHDPQLYPLATLPLTDLMRAWHAADLGYVPYAYTFRCSFHEQHRVSHDHLLRDTLRAAQELSCITPNGLTAYGGATAFALVTEVLHNDPSGAFSKLLAHLALPLGARRCADAAGFLAAVGSTAAAHLMVDKAETYGQAQYHAVQKDWKRTTELFRHLAEVEAKIVQSI
jgi:hypothetical protein